MRNSCLRSAALAVTLSGCVSGSDDRRHGPIFNPIDPDSGAGSSSAPPAEGGGPIADAEAHDVTIAPDASFDVSVPEAGDAAACAAEVAVVAGSATSLYEASFAAGGPWVTSFASVSVLSQPALVAAGSGFHAVLRTSGDLLKSVTSQGASWSQPSGIGASTTTIDAPALAVAGSAIHVVYLGSNSKFYHGTFSANAWDMASDPVGAGLAQSFGPSPPSATFMGGSLTIAQSGSDHFLYDQSLAGSGWGMAHQQSSAMVSTVRPTISGLTGGGNDAIVVFGHVADNKIAFTTQAGGAWSPAAMLDGTATSVDPVSVAPLAGGRAALVYRSATDQKSYFSIFDATKTPVWSVPLLLAGAATPAGPPAVATGVCGDDAIAAYPLGGDNVQVVRLRGGAWTAPEAVPTTNGATRVAIATRP